MSAVQLASFNMPSSIHPIMQDNQDSLSHSDVNASAESLRTAEERRELLLEQTLPRAHGSFREAAPSKVRML